MIYFAIHRSICYWKVVSIKYSVKLGVEEEMIHFATIEVAQLQYTIQVLNWIYDFVVPSPFIKWPSSSLWERSAKKRDSVSA